MCVDLNQPCPLSDIIDGYSAKSAELLQIPRKNRHFSQRAEDQIRSEIP